MRRAYGLTTWAWRWAAPRPATFACWVVAGDELRAVWVYPKEIDA